MPQTMFREGEQHLIENYELTKADNFKGWVLHHRLEFDLEGNEVHTPKSLKRLKMYWRRPYFELIYMTRHDHQVLHNKAKKGKFSEERRKHLSEGTKRVMSNPEMKAMYDKVRYRFPKGNTKGKTFSEFGRKFKEHYGLTKSDNEDLYTKEYSYYIRNKKCRWE